MKLDRKVELATEALEIVLLGLFAGLLVVLGEWVIRAVLR